MNDRTTIARILGRVADLQASLRRIVFLARTTGGTAGPDSELMVACQEAEALLSPAKSNSKRVVVPHATLQDGGGGMSERIEYDPRGLAKSQAVTAINVLIDEALTELRMQMTWSVDAMKRAVDHGGDVNVRVSYEGGRQNEPIPLHHKDAERIAEALLAAVTLHQRIAELGRFKLRLFNDYDFTHGDTTTQYAVFGDPNAGPAEGQALRDEHQTATGEKG